MTVTYRRPPPTIARLPRTGAETASTVVLGLLVLAAGLSLLVMGRITLGRRTRL